MLEINGETYTDLEDFYIENEIYEALEFEEDNTKPQEFED
jgi:hypothetical protein